MSARPAAESVYLAQTELYGLVSDLAASGAEVIAPVAAAEAQSPAAAAAAADRGRRTLEYRVLAADAEPILAPGMPRLSLKGFFLPQAEALFAWKQRGSDIEIERSSQPARKRIALGVKPCDAAALAIVDKVMSWDYADEPWDDRRTATTVFTLACGVEDASCFCTAVGLAPDSTKGADGRFTPVEGGWLVEATTEKGAAFLTTYAARFAPATDALREGSAAARQAATERVAANLEIDAVAIRDWIETHFDDPLLAALGVRCNGCGVCASVCPTCHCFDIVDESDGIGKGTRRRTWDTCQSTAFTLHASGHNPRRNQHARFRQRLNHKFSIYPLRFGEVLCTGCGRCGRECHAGHDLVEILAAMDVAARRPVPVAGEATDGSQP